MPVSSLQVLADNRNALLLAEVAALLHDVGKFCNLHIEAHSQGGTRRWSNDHAYKAVVDNPSSQIQLSPQAASIRKPAALNNVLNAQSPKAADFLGQYLKDFLCNNSVSLFGETYTLAELIVLGTPGFATDGNCSILLSGKTGWLPAALGVCHNEAHVDKQEPSRNEGQQSWPKVYISTAFGFEGNRVVVDNSSESLDNRLKNLQPDRKVILENFVYGLGDTRRPINEVLLSDWAWVVSSLFKSTLAGALLKGQHFGIRQWKSWPDKIIDHDLRWRILRVNFDVLGLYAKAVKIADLVAYQRAVRVACNVVKHLVEWRYPLGNEIYRDTTGIYFTFPDLDLPADLAQEIRRRVEMVDLELAPRIAVERPQGNTATEQLKRMLADARTTAHRALAQPFAPENLSPCWQQQWDNLPPGKWEVCPVCRLRPMEEGREACETCLGRRASRITAWLQNPAQTIWVDELADHNDRVALLVGRFGLDDWLSGDLVQTMLVRCDQANNTFTPKNPSPARLRRVWETCQRFWTETAQKILADHQYAKGTASAALRRARVALVPDSPTGWREGIPYDGTINGQTISLFWMASQSRFLTVFNLQLGAGKAQDLIGLVAEWHGKTVQVVASDRPDERRQFTVARVDVLTDKKREYTPCLSLLASPDQFLALVPACDALEIAKEIHQKYQDQFGKVQNRLPLFLGLVFFPRKMPLAAVMDAGRRMLEQTKLDDEKWRVECNCPDSSGAMRSLSLSLGDQRIDWTVPTKMGDRTTDDNWYPYFALDGNPAAHHSRRFKHKGGWWVHVGDVQPGDGVSVTPSRFAYLWLENTAQRFRFDPQKDVLLLDELQRLMEMWENLKGSGITNTALHGVWALLEAKGRAWGLQSPEFKRLAETTLVEAHLFRRRDKSGSPLPDVVTSEDVTDGRLFRCLHLYLTVVKQRIA